MDNQLTVQVADSRQHGQAARRTKDCGKQSCSEAAAEDWTRNVVLFGLPEQKDENVEERIQKERTKSKTYSALCRLPE